MNDLNHTGSRERSERKLALDRRALLRALGIGGAGLAAGGLGFLTGCSDDGSRATAGGTTSTTGPVNTVPKIAPTPHDPDLPYWMQGNFRGVPTEETVTELAVRGALPPELSGLFVRNGSNPGPGQEPVHWFLGDGMIHGIRIEGGKASWYRNRYVKTPINEAGKDLLDFGGVPGQANNQSNVALVHHADKLLSLGEVGWPYEMSTADLSTVGALDYGGSLGSTMTAHPKIDPATGRLHFFGYDFIASSLTYYAADAAGILDVISPIEIDAVTMVHDFAITDRDVVFWIGPVMFGGSPDVMYPDIPFHWDPDGPCRVGVMPLDGSGDQIRWVDIPACFVFHGYNAHREGDEVVLRVHQLPSAFGPDGDLVDSQLTEWRIGTGGDRLTFRSSPMSDRVMDLPSHDRRHTGRPTRHGWFATTTSLDDEYGFELAGIAHLDLRTGAEDVWDPPSHLRAGEGFFVPATDGDEGEGWVLTYIWDRTTDTSAFAVFDSQDVASGPVAEIDLGVRVPFGFHGLWLDESVL